MRDAREGPGQLGAGQLWGGVLGHEQVALDARLEPPHAADVVKDVKGDAQASPAPTVLAGQPEREPPRMEMGHPAVEEGVSQPGPPAQEGHFPAVPAHTGLLVGPEDLEGQLLLEGLGLLSVIGVAVVLTSEEVPQTDHVGAVREGAGVGLAGPGQSGHDVGLHAAVVDQEGEDGRVK